MYTNLADIKNLMYSTTCQRTIIGYGFTHNNTRRFLQTSRTMTQAQDQNHSLSKHINEAKDRLNHLKDLSKEDIKDYQTRIDRAKMTLK